jgi:hypothetical protein
MSEDAMYSIGYKKPPEHTRFRKGRSGNPLGRRKQSEPFLSVLAKALGEQVCVTAGGRRYQMTKREALASQLANKAATGDLKAAKLLVTLITQIDSYDQSAQAEGGHSQSGKPAREIILERLEKMARAKSFADAWVEPRQEDDAHGR